MALRQFVAAPVAVPSSRGAGGDDRAREIAAIGEGAARDYAFPAAIDQLAVQPLTQDQTVDDAPAARGRGIRAHVTGPSDAAWLRALEVGRLDAGHPNFHAIRAPQRTVSVVNLHDLADEGRWKISGHVRRPSERPLQSVEVSDPLQLGDASRGS